jgi:hypothetical protein
MLLASQEVPHFNAFCRTQQFRGPANVGSPEEIPMIRYGFQIRTKTGQRVDNISIIAATQGDAERRLRQMYMSCEVIECREQCVPRRVDTLDVEGVIGLISGASISALPSLQKAGTH